MGISDWSSDVCSSDLSKQGRVPFGVELRIVDDTGVVLPRDGVSAGRLEVRGPWVVKRSFRDDSGDCLDDEGWFDTGDDAVLHPDGTMLITDRSKDVIKSGGEWISSVELEKVAVGCPGVAEAGAQGIAHTTREERSEETKAGKGCGRKYRST